ncbi:MAG TPA: ribosome maturation factor RimP [bacterium]
MKDAAIVHQIKGLIVPLLESHLVDLVDIELKGKPGNQVLKIFVDCDGGITIGRCQAVGREISDLLDMKDLIPGKYRLEVSSPGLDRPLKVSRDFQRQMGRKVRVVYSVAEGGEKIVVGKIAHVQDDLIVVESDDEKFEIKLSQVLSAKIVTMW